MRKYKYEMKTVEVATKVLEKHVCDYCRADIKELTKFSRDEITVVVDEGTVYPEGGCFTRTTYDLCANCFERLVADPIKARGGNPDIEEIDA